MKNLIKPYNSPINIDLVMHHFNLFVQEMKSNKIEYMQLSIELFNEPSSFTKGEVIEVILLKTTPINLRTKMTVVKHSVSKNGTLLIEHFKDKTFENIMFSYTQISYTKLRALNDIKNQKLLSKQKLLKSLIHTYKGSNPES